jgi:hypothetical protein
MKYRTRNLFPLIAVFFLFVPSVFAQYNQTIHLNYINADRVERGLKRVIAYSQQVMGGGSSGGNVGDYVNGTISAGAGNGLTFLDVTVELISLEGDTANPSARLYIFTPTRDREVTMSKGNSELVDNYRVRLDNADKNRGEAEITIRLAGNGGGVGINTGNGQHPAGKVSVKADSKTATITISAAYPTDLQNLAGWVQLWDIPANKDYTDNSYNPPAYLLNPGKSISTTGQSVSTTAQK